MIINNNICNLNDDTLVKLHLHGSPSYSFEGNNKLIKVYYCNIVSTVETCKLF